MQLVLTEDQELLASTVAEFVSDECSVAQLRELRDSRDATGFSRKLWKQMADLGWLGILYPESLGGADLGLAEMAVVMEALGRSLTPEPFLSSILLGGQALLEGGSEEQKESWLPPMLAGDKLLTLAFQEAASRYDLCHVTTRARAQGDGFRISGEKVQVLDGHVADAHVVVARTSGADRDAAGRTLFLLPRGAEGLSVERQIRVDSRNAALVRFDDVAVGSECVLGDVGAGGDILDAVVDRAAVGLSAEMLGSMSEAFHRTLTYLKQREQFGVVIGSFQALKHRAAEQFIEIELCRSAVMAAARALDEGSPEGSALAALTKARCSDTFVQVANEAVQMHGGIGMTDEHEIGFFLKRARAAEMTFGDAAWHRSRWATLKGY